LKALGSSARSYVTDSLSSAPHPLHPWDAASRREVRAGAGWWRRARDCGLLRALPAPAPAQPCHSPHPALNVVVRLLQLQALQSCRDPGKGGAGMQLLSASHIPATCGPSSRAVAGGSGEKRPPYLLVTSGLSHSCPCHVPHSVQAEDSLCSGLTSLLQPPSTSLLPPSFPLSSPRRSPTGARTGAPAHLGGAQLPLALSDLQRWSQLTGRGL
jgi:hypothetical protein